MKTNRQKNSEFAAFGSFLRRSNPVVFILIMVGMFVGIQLLQWIATDLLQIPDLEWHPIPSVDLLGFWGLLIVGVLVAPWFETLIFQKFFYFLLRKIRYCRQHRWIIVVVSALIFGLNHYYSLLYIIWATLMGAVMMYGYIVRRYRGSFWLITAVHAINNMAAVIASYYFSGV